MLPRPAARSILWQPNIQRIEAQRFNNLHTAILSLVLTSKIDRLHGNESCHLPAQLSEGFPLD